MFGKEVLLNGPRILLLFRYGEANRSGDDCHRKEILLPFLTGGAWHALQGHTGSTTRQKEQGKGMSKKPHCGVFRGKE